MEGGWRRSILAPGTDPTRASVRRASSGRPGAAPSCGSAATCGSRTTRPCWTPVPGAPAGSCRCSSSTRRSGTPPGRSVGRTCSAPCGPSTSPSRSPLLVVQATRPTVVPDVAREVGRRVACTSPPTSGRTAPARTPPSSSRSPRRARAGPHRLAVRRLARSGRTQGRRDALQRLHAVLAGLAGARLARPGRCAAARRAALAATRERGRAPASRSSAASCCPQVGRAGGAAALGRPSAATAPWPATPTAATAPTWPGRRRCRPRCAGARSTRGRCSRTSATPRAHETFRKELAWREFYADVLRHEPESAREYLRPELAEHHSDRRSDADARVHGVGARDVRASRSSTPGMRQLRAEGWMHNRVRMVVASFLVKDLHLDWRRGARGVHALAARRRPGLQPAWLAVGGRLGHRRGAVLPGVQPGPAGTEVRPRRGRTSAGTSPSCAGVAGPPSTSRGTCRPVLPAGYPSGSSTTPGSARSPSAHRPPPPADLRGAGFPTSGDFRLGTVGKVGLRQTRARARRQRRQPQGRSGQDLGHPGARRRRLGARAAHPRPRPRPAGQRLARCSTRRACASPPPTCSPTRARGSCRTRSRRSRWGPTVDVIAADSLLERHNALAGRDADPAPADRASAA